MAGDLDPRAASLVFGRRLRALRIAHGMSQDNLADRMGLRGSAIWRLEHGLREPRLTTILRLARGLGVASGVLVDAQDTPARVEA
jgi:transcriptional regulator with XRE-family HTH domain